MIKNVKIGADPELFIERNNKVISAEGLFGGTKESPKPIGEEGFAIQEDNVMVEFNIPASSTSEEFVENINYGKDYISNMCKLYGDLSISDKASADLSEEELSSPQACQFGCESDFNVYSGKINTPPTPEGTMRCAGGHIHIGYSKPNEQDSDNLIYAMDMVLGLQSVLIDPDTRRKEMYGKAGCFREKKYGVEYRVLSNFWLKNDATIKWAFDSTQRAIKLANHPYFYEVRDTFSNAVEEAINSNDKKSAKSLLVKITEQVQELTKKAQLA